MIRTIQRLIMRKIISKTTSIYKSHKKSFVVEKKPAPDFVNFIGSYIYIKQWLDQKLLPPFPSQQTFFFHFIEWVTTFHE